MARVERSGRKGIAPSWAWSAICAATEPALSNSSSTYRRRSNAGDLNRIDTQEKNWKIKPSDIEERKYWNQYGNAYEECLSSTSTREAPWYVVPADDKLTARLFVSHIILETLDDLKMTLPETTSERREELRAMRKQLDSE